jgi:hypothetical protein
MIKAAASKLEVAGVPIGRPVFIAFCFRGAVVRPISARCMHAREVARHETAFGSNDDDR